MNKKIKNSAKKITMPEELKKRILHECENTAVSETEDYEEHHVFTVDRAKPRRISRIVYTAAACAVLVAGICFAGVNIMKNSVSDPMTENGSIESDEASDAAACKNVPPFGDVSQREMTVKSTPNHEEAENISLEQKQLLADFFSKQVWVDKEFDCTCHNIRYWFDFTDSTLDVNDIDEGFFICTENTLHWLSPTGQRCYRIDFELFDKEIKRILGYEDTEPAENPNIQPDNCTEPPFISVFDNLKTLHSVHYEPRTIELSDDQIKALRNTLIGWDWSNAKEIDMFPADKDIAFMFINQDNLSAGTSLNSITIYTDGSVAVSICYSDKSYSSEDEKMLDQYNNGVSDHFINTLYEQVDNDTNELCTMIENDVGINYFDTQLLN